MDGAILYLGIIASCMAVIIIAHKILFFRPLAAAQKPCHWLNCLCS